MNAKLLALCLLLVGCADDSSNQRAWEAKHPKFAPRNSCRDTSLELALERDTRP